MTATIADIYARAVELHRAGRIAEAEPLYRQILQAQPDHAHALHMLGVAATQRGQHDEAIALIGRAIERERTDPAFFSNLGAALKGAGQLSEAAAAFRNALAIDPQYGTAHKNLAVVLQELNQCDDAIEHLWQALELLPGDPAPYKSFGVLYLNQQHWGQAAEMLTAACALNPEDADALNNKGVALKALGRFDEAIVCYRLALRARPDNADYWNNLGIALIEMGNAAEATGALQEALRLQPGLASAHHALGVAYRDAGSLDEAVASLQEAERLAPDDAEIVNNLGAALQLGGQADTALDCYERALRLNPDNATARYNRGHVLLLRGNLPRGFADYEYRWRRPGTPPRDFPQPAWDGTPLPGCSILLHAEQGLGDTLQFIRFAPLVKERVGAVIVECQAALMRLLSRCPRIDRLIARGDTPPVFDVRAALMSLPLLLRTTLDTLPAEVPYIHPDADLVDRWRQRLPENSYRIGIAWQGNPKYPRDRSRSLPLSCFEPVAQIPGVQLVILQKGQGRDQIAEFTARWPLFDPGADIDESSGAFMDTAAIMQNLDLVITSDTAIPHLAGALGVPVWTVLAFAADWRWLLDRDDSPWYPSMRLFRQRRPGDWQEVFERIRATLLANGKVSSG